LVFQKYRASLFSVKIGRRHQNTIKAAQKPINHIEEEQLVLARSYLAQGMSEPVKYVLSGRNCLFMAI
jgi:hypothetical protein